MEGPTDLLTEDSDNYQGFYYDYFTEDLTLTNKLILYILLILIISGSIGNTLSFCVMLRKEMRQMSTSVYLVALSVADTLCLLEGPLVDMILSSSLFLGWHMPMQSKSLCQLYFFLYYMNPHISSWCLVAVTVERLLVIYFPHR